MRISFSLASFVALCLVAAVAVSLALVMPERVVEIALLLLVLCLGLVLLLRSRLKTVAASLETLAESIPDGKASQANVPLEFHSAVGRLERASARTSALLSEAEEGRRELEVLLQGMQEAVVAVDVAGRIQWSNARMEQLMQREGSAAAIRKGRALVHTVRDPAVLECMQSALESRVVAECRSTLTLRGSIFDVIASPLPSGGAVAVFHDITKADEVERTQRDFVGNVSHELRTPLTSIIGYVETLLDVEETLSSTAREFLETILKNASRMNRLTQDLLVLTRVSSKEQWLHRDAVVADDLLREAIRTVSGTLQREGTRLRITETTEREVMADEHAILQVLENLIENAVKYGRSIGGQAAEVEVSASVREATDLDKSDAEMIEFCVRDKGQGIAMEHAGRIFERFYRVDKARSRETGGTGLGLAIVRHIVEEHDGRVWLESDLGQGSAFHFTLPVIASKH